MDRNVMAKILHMHESRFSQIDQQLQSLFKVLQEIIGKELMRGQALHKVLMDKAVFTDVELKAALESLMAEAKADLEKAKQEVAEEKQKAVEILIPAGAHVAPKEPVAPSLAPDAPVVSPETLKDVEEATNVNPPASA